MHARDSIYDEQTISIMAPVGTPEWLKVSAFAGLEKNRVQARAPAPGPTWEEIFHRRGWNFNLKRWRSIRSKWGQQTGVPTERDLVEQISDDFLKQIRGEPFYPAYRAERLYHSATIHIVKPPGSSKHHPVGSIHGYYVQSETAIRELFSMVKILHQGSPVWLVDFKTMKLDRLLTLWELLMFGEPEWDANDEFLYNDRIGYVKIGKKTLWPVSEKQWQEGSFAQPEEGGPEHVPGMFEAQENPVSGGGGGLICMGREVEIDLHEAPIGSGGRSKRVVPPSDAGMLHDGSGTYWPKCSLLITEFERGKKETDEGADYFGHNAHIYEGSVDLPTKDLAAWHKLGEIDQVFYDRAGTKYPGYFRHQFNKPRGLWRLIWPVKRGAKKPAVLYSLWQRKTERQHYRIELPEGCIVDDRGIVVP